MANEPVLATPKRIHARTPSELEITKTRCNYGTPAQSKSEYRRNANVFM
jgi:hypothetical protein